MAKPRKLKAALPPEKLVEFWNEFTERQRQHFNKVKQHQDGLLKLLNKYGPERFTWMQANDIDSREYHRAFAPDPRFYPALRKQLESVRKAGYPIDGLHVSRIENAQGTYELQITLPIYANMRDYLQAVLVYQQYFQSLVRTDAFPDYVCNRYSDPHDPMDWSELVKEINAGIINWSQGKYTQLNHFGLDVYLRKKGYTPELLQKDETLLDQALFDEQRLRRLIRYHFSKK